MLLSRFSLPYLFPQHFPSHVALCVQNDGVRCKVIQDMVFYSLTPQGCAVTVALICALPYPARAGNRGERRAEEPCW
jgi:hypothetical protein